ncbi:MULTISPECIES: ABC transporter substrate-binding protein [Caldilinea]|jgi:multiple sugar transport system substrate-binding protein|nr:MULTISPECIES: extracellular solute-binding protein [Caldilinea]MBO9392336.1 extracellular solute-binding protein [Caldilinea sp.]GIV71838.1 MAG: sugar ABC transporter substrate-binding protein [Caldilinea sp.]
MRSLKLLTIVAALMVGVLWVAGCAPAAAPSASTEAPSVEAPSVAQPATGERVKVRWFVGLGAGSDEGTFAPQNAFVERFNASQDKIELVLEIVANNAAYDTLATQIAAGNAPCVVGPVGIRGRDSFKGAWLDLQPLIDKYNYDLSDFDPSLVEFYQVKEEGQLGIPFAIFPSFVLYNKDLFDEAGLPYPPTRHGEPYVDENGVERDWNIETLTELAKKLTVDANGNDATSPDFDPENIVQFGWMNQWTDPRGVGTFFGAGSLVDENGNAQIPEHWKAAWKWTYDGWWKDWFIPNGPYSGADFLQGPGGPFSSGNMGMIHIHLWYVAPWALGNVDFDWNIAATPNYRGTITAKMHADTFGILKGCPTPDEAFEVLTYMLSKEHANELLTIYGGMPARLSLQPEYFKLYTETNFPNKTDIHWDTVVEAMAYADNPNHESWMPSFQETTDRYNEFWNYLANTPGVDFDAEVEKLRADLQKIFEAAR